MFDTCQSKTFFDMGTGSFLDPVEVTGPNENGITCAMARYLPEHFHPSMFAALNIARPCRLQGAIEKRQAEYLAGRALVRALLIRLPTVVIS